MRLPGPVAFLKTGTVQGYLAHKKTPTALGPPLDPRHRATVRLYREAFSYERGTLVAKPDGFVPEMLSISQVWWGCRRF